MAAYLTTTEAESRLTSRFGITATLAPGDVDVASDELDGMGPFIGYVSDSTQVRAFPRVLPPLTTATTPDAILDAVALLAYQAATDEDPAIQSESTIDKSITYASPKTPLNARRVETLIGPYLLRVGSRA